MCSFMYLSLVPFFLFIHSLIYLSIHIRIFMHFTSLSVICVSTYYMSFPYIHITWSPYSLFTYLHAHIGTAYLLQCIYYSFVSYCNLSVLHKVNPPIIRAFIHCFIRESTYSIFTHC